jgi:hypothetical protein
MTYLFPLRNFQLFITERRRQVGSAAASYLQDSRLKSATGNRLSWRMYFVISPSPYKETPL